MDPKPTLLSFFRARPLLCVNLVAVPTFVTAVLVDAVAEMNRKDKLKAERLAGMAMSIAEMKLHLKMERTSFEEQCLNSLTHWVLAKEFRDL